VKHLGLNLYLCLCLFLVQAYDAGTTERVRSALASLLYILRQDWLTNDMTNVDYLQNCSHVAKTLL
jgi:hypothetical protein